MLEVVMGANRLPVSNNNYYYYTYNKNKNTNNIINKNDGTALN